MPLVLQNTGGGAEPPPGSYKVVSQQPALLVRSATSVVDAMTITVQDELYGVLFSFTIPLTEWQAEGTHTLAMQYTEWVQEVGALPHVQAMYYVQVPNAAGQLVDSMEITVGTDDLTQTTLVTTPLVLGSSIAATNAVDDAYALLEKTAAGNA